MKKITILIPCYNEQESLPALYAALAELAAAHGGYRWEMLFVNDGSRDHTMDVIRELRRKDSRVAYVDLARNFGKEAAMLAGFDHATGDAVVVMDADLQHPPHTFVCSTVSASTRCARCAKRSDIPRVCSAG